jgi:hypothetical protein
VIEATGNSLAVSGVLSRFAARVIIANPLQVKAIAQAHVKTDKIDAGTLTSLRAAGYLPEIWMPDAITERKRRLAARRYQVVRHRTQEFYQLLTHTADLDLHRKLAAGSTSTISRGLTAPSTERLPTGLSVNACKNPQMSRQFVLITLQTLVLPLKVLQAPRHFGGREAFPTRVHCGSL